MSNFSNFSPIFPSLGPWLIVLSLLDLIVRGVALWRSAKANQTYWFIALLVINSLGILPVIYLLIYKDKAKKATPVRKSTKK